VNLTTENFALDHQIFVLDAYLEDALNCDLQESITQHFVDDAMSVLGLDPLGILGIYPAVDARAPGWSFIQPITTSHISAHYFEKPGKAPHIRIDAYSCDRIDWHALLRVCSQHFIFAAWRATFIDREIDLRQSRSVIDLAGHGSRITHQQTLEPAISALTGSESSLSQTGEQHVNTHC